MADTSRRRRQSRQIGQRKNTTETATKLAAIGRWKRGRIEPSEAISPAHGLGGHVVAIDVGLARGSLLVRIPAIVLFGPLLFPVARSLGVHDVHYAMVVILAMGIGLFAPPFGVGFYAACAIGKVSPDGVFNRVWGYLAALVVALLVVAFVPWISIGFL